ncbi:MAG: pilus assembly protein PilM [Erysipelotrichaceae bacterium]|nr:pilus assembly protein PilM [Erysipelotrichaceae bacterium]
MKDILGIEIGNKTVKFAEFRRGTLRNFIAVTVPDNVVVNDSLIAFEAMGDLIKETVKANKIGVRKAVLVLPGADVSLRRLVLPAMNEKQLMVNMPYEFKDVLSMDKDKYIYDYAMIDYIKDEEGNVKEMELLGAVVSAELIDKYVEMFKRAGIKLVRAIPREMSLSALIEVLNGESEIKDFAVLDLGYKSSKVDIFKNGVYEITTTIDSGTETIEALVADQMGVDEHLAAQYIEMNKDNILESEKVVDIYSRIATEIMRVMNYYAFENPESNLDTLYYCGGGSLIARFIAEIKEYVNLELKPLGTLSESTEDDEAITKGAEAVGACLEE